MKYLSKGIYVSEELQEFGIHNKDINIVLPACSIAFLVEFLFQYARTYPDSKLSEYLCRVDTRLVRN